MPKPAQFCNHGRNPSVGHDLFRPSFARRSGLREGGKPACALGSSARGMLWACFSGSCSASMKADMPASPDDLFAYLDSLGIAAPDRGTSAVLHRRGGPGAARRRCRAGIPRTCSCATRRACLFLVVAQEDAAIELKSLHRLLGATGRFSFGSAELMARAARRRARLGDAVCRHQRHGRPGHRGARCRHDGA